MNRFRIRSSKLYLTYPECDVEKERAFDELAKIFDTKELLVAHELHKNGNSHLHCYIELNSQGEFTSPNFADIFGFHGNYQGCRSAKNVLKYCTKEDDYISSFDVNAALKGRSLEKGILGKRYNIFSYT